MEQRCCDGHHIDHCFIHQRQARGGHDTMPEINVHE